MSTIHPISPSTADDPFSENTFLGKAKKANPYGEHPFFEMDHMRLSRYHTVLGVAASEQAGPYLQTLDCIHHTYSDLNDLFADMWICGSPSMLTHNLEKRFAQYSFSMACAYACIEHSTKPIVADMARDYLYFQYLDLSTYRDELATKIRIDPALESRIESYLERMRGLMLGVEDANDRVVKHMTESNIARFLYTPWTNHLAWAVDRLKTHRGFVETHTLDSH